MKKEALTNHDSFLHRLVSQTEFSIACALFALIVFLSFASEYFLKTSNILNVLSQISRYGIVSVGMSLIIITGGIDLSVGYSVGLTACLCAFFSVMGLPWSVVLLLTLSIGALIGLANGLLITKVKLVPFIVTLAMSKILSGITLLITKGRPISFESPLAWLGSGSILGIPVCVILMFLIMFIGSVFAKNTLWGRNIYAIGNNERASLLSGINVDKLKCLVYVITGFLCAVCGIVVAGNLSSSDASLGTGYDIDIIASVIIGGVAMSGGEGSIWGALIGASIIGVLRNAFVLLGVSAYWQTIVIGVVIILAVTVDRLRKIQHSPR